MSFRTWAKDVIGVAKLLLDGRRGTAIPVPFQNRIDDPAVPDAYSTRAEGPPKVFVSFERRSYDQARAIARALEKLGLDAFAYTPSSASDPRTLDKTQHTRIEQLEAFQAGSPETVVRLEATLQRANAFVFLVSDRSGQSGVCEAEAFSAFLSRASLAGQALVCVVTESSDTAVPDFLSGFPRTVYRRGMAPKIAKYVAQVLRERYPDWPISTQRVTNDKPRSAA